MSEEEAKDLYTAHAVALNTSGCIYSEPILKEFLEILDNSKHNAFCIPLISVAQWLSTDKRDLVKMLLGKRRSCTVFKPQTDYTVETKKLPRGGLVINYFLTPDCFLQLMFLCRNPRATAIKQYFINVERAYRSESVETFEENLAREGETQVLSQPRFAALDPSIFPCEPGVYAIEFQEQGTRKVKIGLAGCGPNSRFQAATKRGINHRLTRWISHPHPRSLESLVHRYMTPSLVTCEPSQTCSREIFHREGRDYDKVIDYSLALLQKSDAEFTTQTGTPLILRHR